MNTMFTYKSAKGKVYITIEFEEKEPVVRIIEYDNVYPTTLVFDGKIWKIVDDPGHEDYK